MPTIDCPNLKALFGDKFRVAFEESYYAERGDHARADDPWLMVLLCQYGHVYPFGPDELAASTDTRRGAAVATLRELPGCRIHQEGSDGMTFVFPLAAFKAVAAAMRPKRRRRMTDLQKAAARERLAKYAFQPGHDARKAVNLSARTRPTPVLT